MTLLPGLCSVALRHLDPAEVVKTAVAGGVGAIEWEARIHVPPGDHRNAERAAGLCADAGIVIPSYGSYVRAGTTGAVEDFAASLVSAAALGAQHVRVWAGDTVNSSAANFGELAKSVSADLATMCDMAGNLDMWVSLEFHQGTLTESPSSALDLIQRVARHNLRSYWQPGYGQPLDLAAASLQDMLPVLSNLHVFRWTTDHTRIPLNEAKRYWVSLFKVVAAHEHRSEPRFAFLEFSKGDTVEQVVADLHALDEIIRLS